RRGRVPLRPGVLRAVASRRRLCARRECDRRRAPDRRRPEARARGGADRGLTRRPAAGAGAVRAAGRRPGGPAVITLYDAPRCPYCARVRIVLAEKGVEYETVVVDLDDRPAWIYEKNPLGRVPVLEERELVLP